MTPDAQAQSPPTSGASAERRLSPAVSDSAMLGSIFSACGRGFEGDDEHSTYEYD
jgi:hypothetical protein